MSTPLKFSVSNDAEPLAASIDDWIKNAVSHMIDKALLDRDGTLILNVSPLRIDCEYTPGSSRPTTL